MDLARGAAGGALDVPDGGRFGSPGRAEHRLRVAVDVAELRGCGVGREDRGCLVPLHLQVVAVAAAGLVPARDEDHPFGWAGFEGVRGEECVVVGHCEGVDDAGGDFGGGGGDGGFDRLGDVGLAGEGGGGGWDVGFGVLGHGGVEDFEVVEHGDLLCGG